MKRRHSTSFFNGTTSFPSVIRMRRTSGNDEGLKRVLRGTPEQVVAHFTAVSEPCPVCGATTVACPSGTVCPNGHGF